MASTQPTPLPWSYAFNTPGNVEEAFPMDASSSPYFWLNSGGRMLITGGYGSTMIGDAPPSDKWYQAYRTANPVDTDNGLHPQNLFRLYTRNKYGDISAEITYEMMAYNASNSSNRKGDNGMLVALRVADDGQTLYYGGIRVDGLAVIKSKKGSVGAYTTMGTTKVIAGTYNRDIPSQNNLIPLNTKIRIKFTAKTEGNTVRLILEGDIGLSGSFTKWLEVVDSTSPILTSNHILFRTDFACVKFDNISLYVPGGSVPVDPTPTEKYNQGWNDRGAAMKAYIDGSNK